MSMKRFILDAQGEPVEEPDLMTWAKWFEHSDRRVRLDRVGEGEGSFIVSTVFLALDHFWGLHGPPVVWETMVFRRGESLWMERCAGSREQAEAMHMEMLKNVEETERKKEYLNARIVHGLI